jgi:hypothetical protein
MHFLEPCVWLVNQDSILAWSTLERGKLNVDKMLAAKIRRRKLYPQMTITINPGLQWEDVPALSIQDAWSMESI